jgi:hypothetical protein
VEKPSLDGCWAKVARAREHTQRLEALAEGFLKRRPNQVSFDDYSESPWVIIRAVVEPIPIEFSMVAGDVIHNLRSGLDHLAWQLVLLSGAVPGRHTSFPLYTTESEFDSGIRNPPKGRKSPLDGIDPAGKIWALIERSQPYQPAMRDPLEILPTLSNRDKHQGVLVGLSFVEGIDPDNLFTVEGGKTPDIRPGLLGSGPLEHNAEIARIHAPGGQVKMKADPPFQIMVSDGEKHAVSIGALDRLRSCVVKIIRDSEPLF